MTRVVLLYSRGPHIRAALRRLRETFTDAELYLLAPAGFPRDIAALADYHIPVPARLTPSGLLRLLLSIRKRRPDHFVVMFPSFRLTLFAQLTGARQRWILPPDVTLRPLAVQPLRSMVSALRRRVRGELIYRRIRREIRQMTRDGRNR